MKALGPALLLCLAVLLGGCGDSVSKEEHERTISEVRAEYKSKIESIRRIQATKVRRMRSTIGALRLDRNVWRKQAKELDMILYAPAFEGLETGDCDSNYSGCLDPSKGDYDCRDGDGDGPGFTGEVRVLGIDTYVLDADGDGIGCNGQ